MEPIVEHSRPYRILYFCFFGFLITSFFSISLNQGFLALCVAVWLYGLIRKTPDISFYRSGLERHIAVFVGVSVFVAFLSPMVVQNLQWMGDHLLAVAFFVTASVVSTREDLARVIKALVVIAMVSSVAGIVQLATGIDFSATWVRFAKTGSLAPVYGKDLVEGLLGLKLSYGGYMMTIMLPLAYLSFARPDEVRGWSRLPVRVGAVISFVAVVISWTRSALVALPAAAFPLFFKRKKLFVAIMLIIIVVVMLVLSMFGQGSAKRIIGPDGVNVHADSVRDFFVWTLNLGSPGRVLIWQTATRVWLKHPVFGAGGAHYYEVYKEVMAEHPDEQPPMISHAHNDYLNMLARKGIVGFAAFIYLLAGLFRYMVVNLRDIRDPAARLLYMGLFASLCCFCAAMLFQCYFSDDKNVVMFWFVAGLLAAIVKIERAEREAEGAS